MRLNTNEIYCISNTNNIENDLGVELESLQEYDSIARKLVSKYNKRHINNEETISLVIDELIAADIHWDGVTGSKNGYRYRRAKWILGIIRTTCNKLNKHNSLSLDDKETCTTSSINSIVEDYRPVIIDIDNRDEVQYIFGFMKNQGYAKAAILFLYSYYIKSMNLEEIAALYHCTKQNVQQTIKRTLDKLRAQLSNGKEYPTRPTTRSTG